MTGRIPFGLFTLLTVLVCAPIQAQDQMGPPPGYNLQPAGHHLFQDEPGQYRGVPLINQRDPGPQIPGPPPSYVYEQLPDDLGIGGDEDTELGKLLTNTFRHAWFRSEYLQWTVSKPGSVLLGEQTSNGVANPNVIAGQPVNVPISAGITFNRSVNGIPGQSQSPSLDGLTIQNSNGFRGTFGLPIAAGSLELSGFVLATNSNSVDGNSYIQQQILANPAVTIGNVIGQTGPKLGQNGLPATNFQPAHFISQVLLTNGVTTPFNSATFIDYDVSYQARLTTSAWGTEGNYVMDSVDPNSPFQFRPTFGFRYFNFRDRLDQTGQYNQPDVLDPTVTSVVTRQINSSATNNVFGPQMGVRAELAYSRFLIGVEPKVMLGINSYQTELVTSNILSSTDPGQALISRSSTFSPMVDLKGYGSVSLSSWCSAYIAYNYLWAGNVTRSFNDVVYNRDAITNHSDFSIQKTLTNVSLQGISLGFEFRY